MGCPYTAVKEFFQNTDDQVSKTPVVSMETASEVPPEKDFPKAMTDAEVLIAYSQINNNVRKPTPYSASTIRGNRTVRYFIGQKKPGEESMLAMTEAHGVLRWTIGEIGRKLDKTIMPTAAQADDQELDACVKTYRGETKKLRRMYEDYYGGNSGVKEKIHKSKEYAEVAELIKFISELQLDPETRKEFESSRKIVRAQDIIAGDILDRFDENIKEAKEIRFKGDETILPNKRSNRIDNPVAWMFYAEQGAIAFYDTTKIPNTLSKKIEKNLGTIETIAPKLIDHLEKTPEMQQPVIMNVFHRGVEKLQNTIVQCGTWNDLRAGKKSAGLLDAVNIKNEKNYDAVKYRALNGLKNDARENKTEIVEMSESASGCPYMGFKSKIKALRA